MQTYRNDFKSTSLKFNDYNGDLSKKWYIDFGYCFVGKRKKYKRIWIPFVDNRQHRYNKANEILKQLESDKSNLVSIEKKATKTDTIIEDLKRMLESKQIESKSVQTYITSYKKFIGYLNQKHINYKKVNQSDLRDFQNYLKVQNNYKLIIFSNLRACYSVLVDNSIVPYNPFIGYDLKVRHTETDSNYPFSEYERGLIEDCLINENYRLYLFTRFIYFGFIRPKELLNIRVSDVNLRLKTITVSGGVGKTKRFRNIPIIKPLLDLILENGLVQYPNDYYLFGQGLEPSRIKMGINTPTEWHKQVLKRLGIYVKRKTVMYSWKHTGNINAYLNGVDIKLIQLINGHSSVQTTEIYLKKLGVFLDKRIENATW